MSCEKLVLSKIDETGAYLQDPKLIKVNERNAMDRSLLWLQYLRINSYLGLPDLGKVEAIQ
jgi:hypothetical protein